MRKVVGSIPTSPKSKGGRASIAGVMGSNPIPLIYSHYDVWFLVPTDGINFNVDPKEFHATKWLTIEEAERIVTDAANLKALEQVILSNK